MDFKKLDDGTAAFNAFYEAINNSTKEKWDETKKIDRNLWINGSYFLRKGLFYLSDNVWRSH